MKEEHILTSGFEEINVTFKGFVPVFSSYTYCRQLEVDHGREGFKVKKKKSEKFHTLCEGVTSLFPIVKNVVRELPPGRARHSQDSGTAHISILFPAAPT